MKILIAGDFCPQYRVAVLLENGDYQSVLNDVKGIVSDADYAIVNFECAVTIGGERPIEKCGPNLLCSEHGIEALKWAGFDCVTLANNHFYDYGEDGVKNTLAACKEYGMDGVGGGVDLSEAAKVLYKRIGNETVAIINCCEHEFSIATEVTGGSNPLNPIQQYYAIQEAKRNANYVLVIVHGGHEYYQLPSPRMQEMYRFFVEAGADAIVNHHQHCYSGYEVYRRKPIFYGLGNLCFDKPQKREGNWNEGYMVSIELSDHQVGYQIYPYIQCNQSATITSMIDGANELFQRKLLDLNEIIGDPGLLKKKYQEFLDKIHDDIKFAFSPYSSHLTKSMCHRHILPSFLSERKKKLLLAYLQCESHYESVLNYLKSDK